MFGNGVQGLVSAELQWGFESVPSGGSESGPPGLGRR